MEKEEVGVIYDKGNKQKRNRSVGRRKRIL